MESQGHRLAIVEMEMANNGPPVRLSALLPPEDFSLSYGAVREWMPTICAIFY